MRVQQDTFLRSTNLVIFEVEKLEGQVRRSRPRQTKRQSHGRQISGETCKETSGERRPKPGFRALRRCTQSLRSKKTPMARAGSEGGSHVVFSHASARESGSQQRSPAAEAPAVVEALTRQHPTCGRQIQSRRPCAPQLSSKFFSTPSETSPVFSTSAKVRSLRTIPGFEVRNGL